MPVIQLERIAPALRKFCDPDLPAAMRAMAAKGMVPLPPKDLVVIQAVLARGADEAIAAEAKQSLRKYPEGILLGVVKSELPGEVLDVLADTVVERPPLLEALLLNQAVEDGTLARLAPALPERMAELLFQNEQRILRSIALVLGLRNNSAAPRSSVDRMFDLLVRGGILLDDVPEFADALLRLTPEEREEAVSGIEVPEDLLDPGYQKAPPSDEALLDAELVAEPTSDTVLVSSDDDEVKLNVPLMARVGKMSMAQKVKLALMGNKEARAIFLRDSNRLISLSAIKNPKITEQEVSGVAKSRSVNEDVMRVIAANREWMRSYQIKLALVQNPKTSPNTAMKLLPLLREQDVRVIARSKNIPTAVANQAKAIVLRTK